MLLSEQQRAIIRGNTRKHKGGFLRQSRVESKWLRNCYGKSLGRAQKLASGKAKEACCTHKKLLIFRGTPLPLPLPLLHLTLLLPNFLHHELNCERCNARDTRNLWHHRNQHASAVVANPIELLRRWRPLNSVPLANELARGGRIAPVFAQSNATKRVLFPLLAPSLYMSTTL